MPVSITATVIPVAADRMSHASGASMSASLAWLSPQSVPSRYLGSLGTSNPCRIKSGSAETTPPVVLSREAKALGTASRLAEESCRRNRSTAGSGLTASIVASARFRLASSAAGSSPCCRVTSTWSATISSRLSTCPVVSSMISSVRRWGYLKSVSKIRTRVTCPGPGPATSAASNTFASGNLRNSSSDALSSGLGFTGTVRVTALSGATGTETCFSRLRSATVFASCPESLVDTLVFSPTTDACSPLRNETWDRKNPPRTGKRRTGSNQRNLIE